MRIWSLGQDDLLEREMETHCSVLSGESHWRGAWQAAVPRVAKSQIQLSTHIIHILKHLRRHIYYTLLLISCDESSGINKFFLWLLISSTIGFQGNIYPFLPLHLGNGRRGCQSLAAWIKKSRVLLCARDFMLIKYLYNSGTWCNAIIMCHLDYATGI